MIQGIIERADNYSALVRENAALKEEIKELEKELRTAHRDMHNLEQELRNSSVFGLHDNY